MNENLLDVLLKNLQDLSVDSRMDIFSSVKLGNFSRAMDILNSDINLINKNISALQALQLHILHLAGHYREANYILDKMIGINLSAQLSMENCPSQDEIIDFWDFRNEGISILCPTFNHARFIDMALASFFSQYCTHPFEVIVRDDASVDSTLKIIENWEKKYPKIIKIIKVQENTYKEGMSPMMSTLKYAVYPLVAMCEGDDFWVDSNKLEIQAKLLQKNTDWSAVTHNHFDLYEVNGKLVPGRNSKIDGFISKEQLINLSTILVGNTLMFRKSLFSNFEYDLRNGVLGDHVMTAMLGIAGRVFAIGSLFGSVMRRNNFSTWTPSSEFDKETRRINTRKFLVPILEKKGEIKAAQRMLRWSSIAENNLFQ